MRQRSILVLILCLVVSLGALAERFDRGLGDTLYHVVAAGGERLVVTAYDEELSVTSIPGWDQEMQVITPAFGKSPKVFTGQASVSYVLVKDDKVVEIKAVAGALPAVPENGYLIIAYGRSAISFVAQCIQVGDPIAIEQVKAVSPKSLPKTVISPTGDFIDITAWNRGRGADELIVYTPDYGSHTYTNEWGHEIAVVNDEVVAIRPVGQTGLFEIPSDGYVLSGHGSMANVLGGFMEWDWVEMD